MRTGSVAALAALCALAATTTAPAEAATRHPAAGGLAARLQVLEDRAAIEDLLESYTAALDSSDWNAYADVFARDGQLVWLGQTMNGREAIRTRMSSVVLGVPRKAGVAAPAGAGPGRNPQRHILSNIQIRIDGDHATTAARWTLVIQLPDGKDAIDSTGRYADQLVREDGHWKIAHRVISGDIPVS